MDVESSRSYCLSFPQATENPQWGDDLCFKIGGKIFLTLFGQSPRVFQMCSGEVRRISEAGTYSARALCRRYNWVVLNRLDALRDGELQELIPTVIGDGGSKGAEE